jgi:guanylate kinase
MKEKPPKALMIVVSAPSGAGKSTLCNRLVADFPNIVYSVSCTTRPPRGTEQNGVEYYFLSKEEFLQRVERGDFLEYAEVHGNYYGTLAETVLSAMDAGNHVLLDIDVQGAAQVRERAVSYPENHPLRSGFLDIFILPPSLEELERRLRGRGTDSEAVIQTRLQNARRELAEADHYRYRIVNDDLDTAYNELRSIILQSAG